MDKSLTSRPQEEQDEIQKYVLDKDAISEISKIIPSRKIPEIPTYPDELLRQRQKQRTILFYYCLIIIGTLMTLMFVILFFQIFYRLDTGLDLLNPIIYNTVFVSVIIQFIGVIYIIAKKLWDEDGMIPIYSLSKEYKNNSKDSF
ncbi:MAG TPA: hypothetical protein ENH20_00235 [Candidatus Pacearchaeota archaeon]|nr:hypothetical protein [Candidatus Pacearchaeota archaeon]